MTHTYFVLAEFPSFFVYTTVLRPTVFVQCYLDREGASELLIDLIINNTYSNRIFVETIELAIALLEGGNTQVQVLCSLLLFETRRVYKYYLYLRVCLSYLYCL